MISQKIQWGMTFVVQLFDSGSLNLNLWPLHLYVYLLGILPANTEKDKKSAVHNEHFRLKNRKNFVQYEINIFITSKMLPMTIYRWC